MTVPKLTDLDRCLHGRHAVDPCLSCPGGWSLGNRYLVDGQRLGTDLGGKPLLVGKVWGPQRRGGLRVPAVDPRDPMPATAWREEWQVVYVDGRGEPVVWRTCNTAESATASLALARGAGWPAASLRSRFVAETSWVDA